MSAENVLDDKPVVLLATQSRLSAKSIIKLLEPNFSVIETEDAESSWNSMIGKTSVNVLMSDLDLMQDQFGLLERMKTAQNKLIRKLPILLLVSEKDDDSDREAALSAGANDFLTMPFSSAELLARVRMHAQYFLQQEKIIDADKDETIDILQQLAPETFFESRLQQELSFSTRHKIPVSTAKVEINNLDEIEKQYGHKTAHQMIKLFAKLLDKTVRKEDTLSYSGHGRFTILYPATNAIGALVAIKRIKEATDKTSVTLGENSQSITFSAAIYTSLASEAIDTDMIQNELDNRIEEALKKGVSEIVTSGHKEVETDYLPSVERALTLIEKDNTDDLKKHSKALMTRVIPLLRFSDAELKLGMEKSSSP